MKINKRDISSIARNFISVLEDNGIEGMRDILNRLGNDLDINGDYISVYKRKSRKKDRTLEIIMSYNTPDQIIPIELRLIPKKNRSLIFLRAEEIVDGYEASKIDEFGNILQNKIIKKYQFSLVKEELAKLCMME